MPRKAPRSLFASLPYDLKRKLKSQTLEPYPQVQNKAPSPASEDGISIEVKQEKILEYTAENGFLATQPASPSQNGGDDEVVVDLTVDSDTAWGDAQDVGASEEKGRVDLQGARNVRAEVEIPEVTNQSINCHSLNAPSSTSQAGPSSSRINASPPFFSPFQQTGPARKKQKGKSKALVNIHQDHPWDCTGLVPRYTNYSEVPSDLAKYFAQRHLYFPLYDQLPLLLDDVGWYSITPQPIAAHIADRCTCDVIVDAFCGVGGNAIEFARTCERVIAIDNDSTRLRLARHNALHSGVADRIEFILGDFTDFARAWKQRSAGKQTDESIDVVFLSPPWGGPEYLTFTAGDSPSSAAPVYPLSAILPIPGDELFHLASDLSPNIAYFLPRNTNLEELSRLAPNLGQPIPDGTSGGKRKREWVEVEEEWVGDKLKAITAYFGGLVSE